jgi:calcineurin-like phosphoesterase family protein
MSRFVTSDTHFGHKNVIKFCPSSRGHITEWNDHDYEVIDK